MGSTLGFARLILACATRLISGAAPNSAIRAGAACACSAAPAIAMPRAVARKIVAFIGFFLNVADRILRHRARCRTRAESNGVRPQGEKRLVGNAAPATWWAARWGSEGRLRHAPRVPWTPAARPLSAGLTRPGARWSRPLARPGSYTAGTVSERRRHRERLRARQRYATARDPHRDGFPGRGLRRITPAQPPRWDEPDHVVLGKHRSRCTKPGSLVELLSFFAGVGRP